MKVILASMFMLMSNPEYAVIKGVVMDSMAECQEIKAVLDEKFADIDYRANNAPTEYKGEDVVYITSECVPIIPSDSF